MNKIVTALIVIIMSSGAYAQAHKSLKDIDHELKQTKSTATAMALIESIAETTPQTDEDVAALGQLMDRFPVEGQKAASKIKDPKLLKSVIKELDRQHGKLQPGRAKEKSSITDKDRQNWLNGYINSQALIQTLGNLKDKNAIPVLRSYLDDADLSWPASIALGQLGDETSLNTMLDSIGTNKNIDLSGYGDKGLVRVVEELDKPGVDNPRKDALISQIKGSPSPERKRLLKELALKHKDARVRDRAGVSLLNSIMVNREPEDDDFVIKWIDQTKNDETGYWAVTSIRVSHGNGDKPLGDTFIKTLVDVLRTSTYSPTRSEAAQTLGMFKVKESLPYLEECVVKDKDSDVRGACRTAYYKISGEYPKEFNPKDVEQFYKRAAHPMAIEYYSKRKADDPEKIGWDKLNKAMNDWKRRHNK